MVLFCLMLATAAGLATVKAYRAIYSPVDELAAVMPVFATEIPPGSTVIARKPHLAFYTDGQWIYLPNLADLEELHEFLRRQEFKHAAYLFYGEMERRYRPQYRPLQSPDAAPAWLEIVVASSKPGNWILYRYEREQDRDGSR